MIDAATAIASPQYIEFAREPSDPTPAGGRQWAVRGHNYTLDYVEARAGDSLTAGADVEHVVIIPDEDVDIEIETHGEKVRVVDAAVVVLPPGSARILVHRATRFVHLVDTRDASTVGKGLNVGTYQEPDPRVAELVVAPRTHPSTGPEVFLLSEYAPEPGRFGTIFRSETFLVNILDPQQGPRDPDRLSPHHHDDFEQGSLAIDGEWIHHLRTPWGPKRPEWREDEHRAVGSPSLTIIPPPVIHTSEAIGPGLNRLIDIFCPVRKDFVEQGWVLNSTNYADAS
ncbi:hypothetical protein [Microbacterium kyungheense]|uniref:5-deoxy-glucuronate isomerase n=1 Tax=Microbacterium kyungheense TaxID=1263636 RepID=A0A543EUE5_9MICO|nr:hypothetical protein [Microbacterium kyungheense]TQM25196.1 hypothetical protein FB391_2657 [Microbacterium kyungheense]